MEYVGYNLYEKASIPGSHPQSGTWNFFDQVRSSFLTGKDASANSRFRGRSGKFNSRNSLTIRECYGLIWIGSNESAQVQPGSKDVEAVFEGRLHSNPWKVQFHIGGIWRLPLKLLKSHFRGLHFKFPIYHIYVRNLSCKQGQIGQHIGSSHLEGNKQVWSFHSTPSVAVKVKPRTLEEDSQIL